AIDPSTDTPLNGVEVKVTFLTVDPGTMRTDLTGDSNPPDNPGPGAYYITLPSETNDYKAQLTGVGPLPPGFTIVVPAGNMGMYNFIPIVTGNSATNHRDDID